MSSPESYSISPHDDASDSSTAPMSLRVFFVGAARTVYWKRFCDHVIRTLSGTTLTRSASYSDVLKTDLDAQTDVVFVQVSGSGVHQALLERLEDSCPLTSVVLVTSQPIVSREGTASFCLASQSTEDEIKAIVFAAMTKRIERLKSALCDPAQRLPTIWRGRFSDLTPQEIRVVEVVQQGVPNKLVAHRLGITVRTVKAHLTHIYRKTGATQRAELIVKCAGLAQTPARSVPRPSHHSLSSASTMRN